MQGVIDSLRQDVSTVLVEVRKLGRTLARLAEDVLAYFDRPRPSNRPTEAINGRVNTCAAAPSGSASSPTTSPAAYWKPEDSDPTYTLDWDEPCYRSMVVERS